MARYRKVDVRVWGDEKFRRLTPMAPSGQGLWLYLITNPNTSNIPGLYRAGEAALAEELGWSVEAFREAFGEVFREGLAEADWKARVVWLPGGAKYNRPESPNVVLGWAAPWDEVPDCALKTRAYRHLKAFTEGLGKAFAEAFVKGCRQPYPQASPHPSPNPDPDPDQEPEGEPARAPDPGGPDRVPGSLASLRSVPDPDPEAAGGPTTYDLLQRFGMAWRDRYHLPWAPDRDASRAARDLLEKQIGALAGEDRAEALADLMPAAGRYLDDPTPSLAKNRHPFPWFVDRFNQYRAAPAAAAQAKFKRFDPEAQPK
jgi:hypothetical protein